VLDVKGPRVGGTHRRIGANKVLSADQSVARDTAAEGGVNDQLGDAVGESDGTVGSCACGSRIVVRGATTDQHEQHKRADTHGGSMRQTEPEVFQSAGTVAIARRPFGAGTTVSIARAPSDSSETSGGMAVLKPL
jgi:hypothetical protein